MIMSVRAYSAQDNAIRHVLMSDVSEDVSKDVPANISIRLIPLQVAMSAMSLRLLAIRATMKVRHQDCCHEIFCQMV